MTLSTRLVIAMVALVVLSAAIIGAFTYRNIETVVIAAFAGVDRVARPAAGARARSLAARPACRRGRLSFRVAVEGIVRASLSGGAQNGIDVSRNGAIGSPRASSPSLPSSRTIRSFASSASPTAAARSCASTAAGRPSAIRVVPDGELQQRGDSDYFQRAIRLGPNEVDVSPIELNQEQGVVELPHVPVIRTAAAIHTPDGRPFGVVVINVDLGAAFARIRAARRPDSQIYRRQRARRLSCFIRIRAASSASPIGQAAASHDDFPDLAGGGDRGIAALAHRARPQRRGVRRRACAGAARPGPPGRGRRSDPVCAGHRACDRGAQLDPRRRSRRRPARGRFGGSARALADTAAGRDDARRRGLRPRRADACSGRRKRRDRHAGARLRPHGRRSAGEVGRADAGDRRAPPAVRDLARPDPGGRSARACSSRSVRARSRSSATGPTR